MCSYLRVLPIMPVWHIGQLKICVGFSNHLSAASYNPQHKDTMPWPIRSYHPWHVQLGFMLSSILLFKTLVLSMLISPLHRHQCPLSFSFSQEWVEQNSTSGSHLLSNILYKGKRKQNHQTQPYSIALEILVY